MKSRGMVRVGLLAGSLIVSSLLGSPSDLSWSGTLTAASPGAGPSVVGSVEGIATRDRGAHVQAVGCEKQRKPSCNKPGRRSTHR